jgi:hypothetical protein
MELGKSEALIEQAANELISKKLQGNEAPAFTNAYDHEDNDLGIANINLSIPDNKAAGADSQGQDDGGFDDYALSVGSRTRENPVRDDQPYQNMQTNIDRSPSDKPTRNDIK